MRSWAIPWVYSLVDYAQLTIFWQLRDFVWNYKGTIIQKLLNGFDRKCLDNTHKDILYCLMNRIRNKPAKVTNKNQIVQNISFLNHSLQKNRSFVSRNSTSNAPYYCRYKPLFAFSGKRLAYC